MKYKSLKGIHPYFYGIRGIYFIWHGEWADPEVSYKGMTVNYYDVEDDIKAIYDEMDYDDPDNFKFWVKRNPKMVKEIINSLWKQLKDSRK